MRLLISTTIGTLILLCSIWYLAAPNGELKLALDSSIQNDPGMAKIAGRLYNNADTHLDEAQAYHAAMSFLEEDSGATITVPPSEGPGGFGLTDILTRFQPNGTVDVG